MNSKPTSLKRKCSLNISDDFSLNDLQTISGYTNGQTVKCNPPFAIHNGQLGVVKPDRNLPLSYASLDHSEELKWPALFINDHENTLFFKKKSFFYFRLFYTHRRAPGCAESFCTHPGLCAGYFCANMAGCICRQESSIEIGCGGSHL